MNSIIIVVEYIENLGIPNAKNNENKKLIQSKPNFAFKVAEKYY